MTYEMLRWVYKLKTVIATLLALAVGAILIALTGHNPLSAYSALFSGSFFDYWGLSATLVKISPILLAGLAVALPLRAGLFNVGAEGQIYIGALCATLGALYMPFLPPLVGIPVVMVLGMIGGALWALIPALLKAYRDLNEVIVTLLMNFIAINIVSFAVGGPLRGENAPYPYSNEIAESFWLPTIMPRTDAHAGVVIALLLAIIVYVVLRYTSVGFAMNTVGRNADAAKYAGFSVRRYVVGSMLCGGALAGLAGCFEVIGLKHRLFHLFSDGYGYDGVVVAFLGNANALGVVVASVFMAGLESGANIMQRAVSVPVTVVDAIKGLVVIFVAGSLAFSFQRSSLARILQTRQRLNEELEKARAGGSANA